MYVHLRSVLVVAVVAMVLAAGCNGNEQNVTPGSASRQPASAAANPGSPNHGGPLSGDLVYVAEPALKEVNIYSFPRIGKPLRSISGSVYGLCSDKAGNVWMSGTYNGKGALLEYRHNGSGPIATLSSAGGYGCAVDPLTGDLAVALLGSRSKPGGVAIYPKATGAPRTYTDPNIQNYAYCAYDSNGNLLVQGETSGSQPRNAYAELVRGKRRLGDVSLSPQGTTSGGVQWDGSYFVVGYNGLNTLYRYSIVDGQATLVGQINLDTQSFGVLQFWIQGNYVAATTDNEGSFRLFTLPYPQGAPPRHHLVYEPYGVTVSVGNGK